MSDYIDLPILCQAQIIRNLNFAGILTNVQMQKTLVSLLCKIGLYQEVTKILGVKRVAPVLKNLAILLYVHKQMGGSFKLMNCSIL